MDGSQDRVEVAGLSVDATLHDFVEHEALPGSGVESERFWAGLRALVDEFGPLIRAALDVRERMQSSIDRFHRDWPGPVDPVAYEQHLRAIGYLVPEPEDFRIGTDGVDPEIASIAGPQLVVPVMNARFATNAANARWGSLYDALYGTDVIDEREGRERSGPYNPVRGAEVVRMAKSILDDHVPLESGSHHDVTDYSVEHGRLVVRLPEGTSGLRDPGQLVGHDRGAIVLRHHGLHLALMVDRDHPVGATDPAGLSDVRLEAAVTTIMDLEDSVAAVDAADKVVGYRHWLRLMQGTLSEQVTKGGRTFLREMSPDWTITGPDGEDVVLPGRALLFVRHVGHLMTTDAVLGPDGEPVSEGILDALVTALAARHDLVGNTVRRNSRTGSMYAVKPKQHGPAEVALTCELFAAVEQILDLPEATIKVGLMDEERRTSVNLKACIHAARERVAFINTGFLDRTGDEIHTSFLAGPMVRKGEMRRQPWIAAYERSNVEVGLACGLGGRAQIGKGMWAAPDNLAEMMEQKIGHPTAGASCAWVPSPTAATLHALHYHRVDVAERQRELGRERGDHLADLLTLPIADASGLTAREREDEIDNNLQGVLGYVVRWVDAGVGCSKVPDITGTPLMEDRATCRISSQHVANWIEHGVVTTDQVEEHLRRMATVVDGQNADDPAYLPMAPSFDGEAFRAARALVLEGARQPSGYTEPLLHAHRLARKGETGPAPTVPREG